MKFEKISYGGWRNCARLSNSTIDLVATLDVGPRIIRFGFIDKPNLFKEYAAQMGRTGGEEWRIYGGHRLWVAPEKKPRTYAPDNFPVEHAFEREILTLTPPLDPLSRLQKQISLSIVGNSSVEVTHRVTNHNPWAVEFAPWALSVMAPGGRAVLPHEEFKVNTEALLPARPLVLWHYTEMSDERFQWGRHFIQVEQRSELPASSHSAAQKIGVYSSRGWGAYTSHSGTFLKSFQVQAEGRHPDFGCNMQVYTDQDMLELESLAPLVSLEPGETVSHVERWHLTPRALPRDEESLLRAADELVAEFQLEQWRVLDWAKC